MHSRYSSPGWIFWAGGTRGNRNQGEKRAFAAQKSPHRRFSHVLICFREKGPIRLTGCWTDEGSILLSGHMALHKQAIISYSQRYIRAPSVRHQQHTICLMLFKARKSYWLLFSTCDRLKRSGTSEAPWKTAHKGLIKAHATDVSMAKVQA